MPRRAKTRLVAPRGGVVPFADVVPATSAKPPASPASVPAREAAPSADPPAIVALAGSVASGEGSGVATDVERELTRALQRAIRPALTVLVSAIVSGDAGGEAWSRLASDVMTPIYHAAHATQGRGVRSVDQARSYGPPPNRGIAREADPALVAAILAARASGKGAVAIARELAGPFRRQKLQPSWVKSVYDRKGDPAPLAVRDADRAREIKRLQAAMERAREIGLV